MVIQMANDQSFVTAFTSQCSGATESPAGHTDQIASSREKLRNTFLLILNPIHEAAASNVQNQS
jgi:hypothetical protein